jgi:putative membrane protein
MPNTRSKAPAHVAALLSLCIAAAVGAQTPAPGTANTTRATTGSSAMGSNNATAKATADSVSRADRKFMEKAAAGGLAEVQFGQMAAQKGTADDVKKFGQRMVDDHGKANDQLTQLARSKGVNLPTQPDHATQREMDKLSKLQGAAFDREYMKHMVSDHKKDVGEFKSESRKAKDGDVKQFASSTLPTLEEHLRLAQAAQKVADGEARTSSMSTGAMKKKGT